MLRSCNFSYDAFLVHSHSWVSAELRCQARRPAREQTELRDWWGCWLGDIDDRKLFRTAIDILKQIPTQALTCQLSIVRGWPIPTGSGIRLGSFAAPVPNEVDHPISNSAGLRQLQVGASCRR